MIPPDWICEILAPNTEVLARAEKMPLYAREGVRHLWFIDPISRLLELYRLKGSSWFRIDAFCDDDLVCAEPFDAFELMLADLWSDTEE